MEGFGDVGQAEEISPGLWGDRGELRRSWVWETKRLITRERYGSMTLLKRGGVEFTNGKRPRGEERRPKPMFQSFFIKRKVTWTHCYDLRGARSR